MTQFHQFGLSAEDEDLKEETFEGSRMILPETPMPTRRHE